LLRLVPVAAIAAGLGVAGFLLLRGGDDRERILVTEYVRAWNAADYAGMYARLSGPSRGRRTAVAFARIHRRALDVATARSLRLGTPVRQEDGSWRVPARVPTRIFGDVRGTLELPVEGEGDTARIAWRPYLVFPGLRRGEELTRSTEMPPRADLTARDGTPLAQGSDRSSPLGAAALAIRGTLGPIPDDRAEALTELGVPSGAQVGLNGLERIFDERLLGRPGGELRAGRRVLARAEPRRAADVRTTIAPGVQETAVTALGARLGGIVALRPRTGEVLAAAGVGFSGLQPPGSTFKIVTLAAALESGVADPGDTFPVQTAATLSGVELQNANGESCGGTLTASFAESCNSVFGPLGAKVGARRLVATAERFGFNEPSPIPGAATSAVPQAGELPDDLAVGSTAIGQGRVQATALQMALVAATIGRDGRRPQPTFDGRRVGVPAPTSRAISARTARTIGRMMQAVVTSGTGTAAAIDGVRVAGKTGTAELRSTQGCTPDPAAPEACPDASDLTDTDAWFAAYAPAGDPEVAVGVLLVQSGSGGEFAAPVAKQVLQAALSG
jgi:cell division protein FtsI/penicillin-binding protein 2